MPGALRSCPIGGRKSSQPAPRPSPAHGRSIYPCRVTPTAVRRLHVWRGGSNDKHHGLVRSAPGREQVACGGHRERGVEFVPHLHAQSSQFAAVAHGARHIRVNEITLGLMSKQAKLHPGLNYRCHRRTCGVPTAKLEKTEKGGSAPHQNSALQRRTHAICSLIFVHRPGAEPPARGSRHALLLARLI